MRTMSKWGVLIPLLFVFAVKAQPIVSEVGFLPQKVSNNAVCEGYINDTAYLFSFAGIDSTKQYVGIHLKCFRYNTQTGQATQLPDLPDNMGKIACAASRIADTIYISGGYHVFANGSELSSNKMHRFNIKSNAFLSNGENIPVATDDHVQVVWRDSLIYLITGWNNTANIPNVQIYNPALNNWTVGTPIPNTNDYKSFGASGAIMGDTIYYFGGASSGFGFNIQNQVRKGIINPANPAQIAWSISIPDASIVGYRMACTAVYNQIHWLGGSNITYNYDGIAYNGTGGVLPNNRDLYANTGNFTWNETFVNELPMDLRGIANQNDTVKYIAGGMLANQTVTNKVYKLEWNPTPVYIPIVHANKAIKAYPNPFYNKISIKDWEKNGASKLEIYNAKGQKLVAQKLSGGSPDVSTERLPNGLYFIKIFGAKGTYVQKMLKR